MLPTTCLKAGFTSPWRAKPLLLKDWVTLQPDAVRRLVLIIQDPRDPVVLLHGLRITGDQSGRLRSARRVGVLSRTGDRVDVRIADPQSDIDSLEILATGLQVFVIDLIGGPAQAFRQ